MCTANQRTPSDERSDRTPSVMVAESNHDTRTSIASAMAIMTASRVVMRDFILMIMGGEDRLLFVGL
jgi:hypothetical protein